MACSSSPLSSDAGRPAAITKAGIQLLASRYTAGHHEAHAWGNSSLLSELWGAGPQNDQVITPMATSFAPLLAQIICAIGSGGPTPAWVLRMVLTPEFLWMGLHQTPFSLIEVPDISPVDICRHCPLVAAGNISTNLSFDESWVAQGAAMEQHLRVDPPAIYNMAVGTGHPEDIDMDRVLTPVSSTFPAPLVAPPAIRLPPIIDLPPMANLPPIIHLPPIITLPPAPTKPKRDWRDGNFEEAEIETEERSTKRTGAKLGWVSAGYTEYETSTWRPSAVGKSDPPKGNPYRKTR